MIDQATVLAVEVAQRCQVGSKFIADARPGEVAGQAGIERVAHTMDHPRIGEQSRDQSKIQKVERHSIGDAAGLRIQCDKRPKISAGQLIEDTETASPQVESLSLFVE